MRFPGSFDYSLKIVEVDGACRLIGVNCIRKRRETEVEMEREIFSVSSIPLLSLKIMQPSRKGSTKGTDVIVAWNQKVQLYQSVA